MIVCMNVSMCAKYVLSIIHRKGKIILRAAKSDIGLYNAAEAAVPTGSHLGIPLSCIPWHQPSFSATIFYQTLPSRHSLPLYPSTHSPYILLPFRTYGTWKMLTACAVLLENGKKECFGVRSRS